MHCSSPIVLNSALQESLRLQRKLLAQCLDADRDQKVVWPRCIIVKIHSVSHMAPMERCQHYHTKDAGRLALSLFILGGPSKYAGRYAKLCSCDSYGSPGLVEAVHTPRLDPLDKL